MRVRYSCVGGGERAPAIPAKCPHWTRNIISRHRKSRNGVFVYISNSERKVEGKERSGPFGEGQHGRVRNRQILNRRCVCPKLIIHLLSSDSSQYVSEDGMVWGVTSRWSLYFLTVIEDSSSRDFFRCRPL